MGIQAKPYLHWSFAHCLLCLCMVYAIYIWIYNLNLIAGRLSSFHIFVFVKEQKHLFEESVPSSHRYPTTRNDCLFMAHRNVYQMNQPTGKLETTFIQQMNSNNKIIWNTLGGGSAPPQQFPTMLCILHILFVIDSVGENCHLQRAAFANSHLDFAQYGETCSAIEIN